MASYTGVKCPVCDKKFDQQDDIVVCPACGAPHHRECYAQKNECAFASDHITGRVWLPPQDNIAEGADGLIKSCPGCGAGIPGDALFCHVCGYHVGSAAANSASAASAGTGAKNFRQAGWPPAMDFISDPLYTVYGGVDPDERAGDETVRDLAAYIGPSSAYYIPRFKMIGKGRYVTIPNFAALLLNFFFYFYRKMYLLGFVSLALFITSVIPGYLYMRETAPITLNEMVQLGFSDLLEQAGIVVPPYDSVDAAAADRYMGVSRAMTVANLIIGFILSVCFNRLYYKKCVSSVRNAREGAARDGKSPDSYRSALMRLGGVSRAVPLITAAAMAAVYFISNTAILYSYIGG